MKYQNIVVTPLLYHSAFRVFVLHHAFFSQHRQESCEHENPQDPIVVTIMGPYQRGDSAAEGKDEKGKV